MNEEARYLLDNYSELRDYAEDFDRYSTPERSFMDIGGRGVRFVGAGSRHVLSVDDEFVIKFMFHSQKDDNREEYEVYQSMKNTPVIDLLVPLRALVATPDGKTALIMDYAGNSVRDHVLEWSGRKYGNYDPDSYLVDTISERVCNYIYFQMVKKLGGALGRNSRLYDILTQDIHSRNVTPSGKILDYGGFIW